MESVPDVATRFDQRKTEGKRESTVEGRVVSMVVVVVVSVDGGRGGRGNEG